MRIRDGKRFLGGMYLEPETVVDTFSIGGLWDAREWHVMHNAQVSETCPHVQFEGVDRDYSDKPMFRCPRVIVMENEGDYNSTGLCLDCVLDRFGAKPR